MDLNPVDFKSGDFSARFCLANNEKSLKLTITNFTGEKIDLELEDNELTQRIQAVESPLLANCVILQTGEQFQILFTKDITASEPFRAVLVADMNYRMEQEKKDNEKKYECPKCRMAKFNSLQNLEVHKELYCAKKDSAKLESADNSILENIKNLILLPMAYHDLQQKNTIQVMGPLHSLVPVVVSRKSALATTNPLFITNSRSLKIPKNLSISHSDLSINIPIIDLDEKLPCTSSALNLSSSSRAASIHSLSRSCSPTSKSSSSEPFFPDRPFSCTCGVSFSSQNTYDAHRQLYCSHTVRESSSGGGPNRNDSSRKVPDKCSKCDFVPATSSQLAMHIRSSHQTTKTFTCLVCGYRAFSMRGVRTHMRSHPSEDAQRFKANDTDDL